MFESQPLTTAEVAEFLERLPSLRVGAVDGVKQACRLGTEPERIPDFFYGRSTGKLEIAASRARELAKPGKQSNSDPHASSVGGDRPTRLG